MHKTDDEDATHQFTQISDHFLHVGEETSYHEFVDENPHPIMVAEGKADTGDPLGFCLALFEGAKAVRVLVQLLHGAVTLLSGGGSVTLGQRMRYDFTVWALDFDHHHILGGGIVRPV